jgi:hypothetical protein
LQLSPEKPFFKQTNGDGSFLSSSFSKTSPPRVLAFVKERKKKEKRKKKKERERPMGKQDGNGRIIRCSLSLFGFFWRFFFALSSFFFLSFFFGGYGKNGPVEKLIAINIHNADCAVQERFF